MLPKLYKNLQGGGGARSRNASFGVAGIYLDVAARIRLSVPDA